MSLLWLSQLNCLLTFCTSSDIDTKVLFYCVAPFLFPLRVNR
jgi:hypothetical protein